MTQTAAAGVRGVIFDLDGTLLDTLADIGNAFNRVLKQRGLPTHPVDAYRDFVGEGAGVLAERALPPDRRDRETLQACVREYIAACQENPISEASPYPGIPELLDGLQAQGVRMAILSNKNHAVTRACVKALLSGWPIDPVCGQRDGVPRKPDPAAAVGIARQFAATPAEILFVGDTAIDMQTAVAAGMTPVGVLWGFRPANELRDNGARYLVAEPAKIIGLVTDRAAGVGRP